MRTTYFYKFRFKLYQLVFGGVLSFIYFFFAFLLLNSGKTKGNPKTDIGHDSERKKYENFRIA